MLKRGSLPVVGIHVRKSPTRSGHSAIEGPNRAWSLSTTQLSKIQIAHAKGIGERLTHQALQQPALIHTIARTFNRCTAGSQIQGTAGTEQSIQGLACRVESGGNAFS